MIEKNPHNNSLNQCKFCGWKFPSDLVEAINENSDFLFCELCGAEIRYNNVKCQEHGEVIKNISESGLDGNTDKSKSSLWKRFYETIKNFIIENEEVELQEILTKKEKEHIIKVYKDPDFPQIFKSNFIIVFARIAYFELEKLKSTVNLKNSKRNLTKAELMVLTESLKPITKKDIKAEFLKNLHKISQIDFKKWLKKLQHKLKSSPTYYNDFITYIQWLIKIIAKIISEMWERTNLPQFEQTILEDLKNYLYTKSNIKEKDNTEELRIEQAEIDIKNLSLEGQELNGQISVYDNDENLETRLEMATLENLEDYNIKAFTDELLDELNNYPEDMYKLNPNRVFRGHSGYTIKDLSKLWGHWDGYVSEKLLDHQNDKDYILPEKNLKELRVNLENKFRNEAKNCYKLINSHKEGFLPFDLFIKELQNELGKISKGVSTTIEDIALIFGYGYGMMNYIRNNNNFLLSKERLSIIRSNINLILRKKAKNVLIIVDKYEKMNPNLPDYANQKYTITKPNFFSIEKPEVMYWFGWLCSDGWVSQPNNVHYQIQLHLSRKDRVIVERFAKAIGYEHDRIFDENQIFEDENGELRTIKSSRVFFGCKPMWKDLKKLGIFDFKNHGRVPQIIKELINIAKRKKPNGKLIETREGRLTLSFLIGFYDGDGNYHGGMSARILNSKKRFLEEITDLFGISNKVNVNAKKVIDEKTGKVIWKTRYQLSLGPELFRQMLLSYKNSLQRKRPDDYKIK